MALLERVPTLVRANLNDLIDKAEDPEKMIKQVILDMQNQLLQVKTQVAIAIADQHLLEKKYRENDERTVEWMNKAELAVGKRDDELARAALERSLSYRQLAESFVQQVNDQKTEVDNLVEAQSKSDMLMAQHRRSRAVRKAGEAQTRSKNGSAAATFDRMKHKVLRDEAVGQAHAELAAESVEDRFAAMEKENEIERLLADIKSRKSLPA